MQDWPFPEAPHIPSVDVGPVGEGTGPVTVADAEGEALG